MLNDFKLKLLTVFTEAINQIDTLETEEERLALVRWVYDFADEYTRGLAAYAGMKDELKGEIKKGLLKRLELSKDMLREGKGK